MPPCNPGECGEREEIDACVLELPQDAGTLTGLICNFGVEVIDAPHPIGHGLPPSESLGTLIEVGGGNKSNPSAVRPFGQPAIEPLVAAVHNITTAVRNANRCALLTPRLF